MADDLVATDDKVFRLTRGWHSNPTLRAGDVEYSYGCWEWAVGHAGNVEIGMPYMLMRHEGKVVVHQVPYTIVRFTD